MMFQVQASNLVPISIAMLVAGQEEDMLVPQGQGALLYTLRPPCPPQLGCGKLVTLQPQL